MGFSEAMDTDSPELRRAWVLHMSVLAIVDLIFRLLSELWLSTLPGDLLELLFFELIVGFNRLFSIDELLIEFDFGFEAYLGLVFAFVYPFFNRSCILLLSVSVKAA